jgi:hypothetical protein
VQNDQWLDDNRIRSLENWLPLAQTENMRHGWKLNATELEQLVHEAKASLELSESVLGARAVLWCHYRILHEEHR